MKSRIGSIDRAATGSEVVPPTTRSSSPSGLTEPYRELTGWALVSGLVVVVVGIGVMVGWLLDVETLKRIGPDLVPMKFNTGFCLALLGIGVVAGGRSLVGRVASATVGLIATVSLAEFITGWNAGIDEALFLDSSADTYPGRMALATAVSLCLGAIGLRGLRLGCRWMVTVAALVLLIVGTLGSLGYLFGVRGLYDVGPFSTMAAHTAAALVILGIGLLANTPNGLLPWIVRGDDPGATVLRRILPVALVGIPATASLALVGEHAGWYRSEVRMALMVVVASSWFSAVAVHMALAVNRSHTSQGLAQQKLRELNASLECRIAERTAELVTSEAWARVLAGSAPVGIFHMDIRGQYTYVNDEWCEISGVAAEQAVRDGWVSGLHVDDRERVSEEWATATAAGLEFDSEFRVVRPTGETLWVHAHVARVPNGDGDGDGAGYVGTVADITARRTAEHALRDTEELFRITFGSSPVGMALVDADGRVVRANRALCDLTNRSLDELVTMRLESILHPDNVGNGERSAGTTGVDQRIVRTDGSVCWVSIRYAEIGRRGAGDPGLTIVQFVDTTERRELEDRLVHMANHDPLTGLLNRRSFDAALESHVAHCKRYGPEGALLILDLDNFKRINDTRGHNAGDQVIVMTAQLLRQRLRDTDVLGRLGGDEFAVLLPVGDEAAARVVAQGLVDEIRAYAATIADDRKAGDRIVLSASVGVAVFDDVERSSDEMLVNADLAMYDAKELGRDRWAVFSAEKHDEPRFKARLTWIDRIEAALDSGGFVLHAQPIVDLITGERVQLELLIRMIGEQGYLIPPGTFLYTAERYGLSNRIDSWVMTKALDLLEATHGDPTPETLAVNISSSSLADDRLLAMVEKRVRAGGFAPDRLVVELAETAALSKIAAASVFAERLHDLGCRLVLRDFGPGFGSFHQLQHVPFDFIKIDGSLVSDCLDDSTNRAIIGSLVDQARSFGKKTIAENVGSDRVQRFLRQRGVDHGQGSHLGPPVPLEEAFPTLRPRSEGPTSSSVLEASR